MVKQLYQRFNNGFNKLMPGLLSGIQWFNSARTTIFVLLFLVVGQIINFYEPFKNFHLYQILVIPAIIFASRAVKHFVSELRLLNQNVASHPIKFITANTFKLAYSKWTIPGLIIIGGLYIYTAIQLQYIVFDLIGFFAFVMMVLMLGTAILGQTMYVYYILLLSRLNAHDEFKYNFYIPARTDWIVRIAKMGRMLNNSFFILGMIYTVVFYLNMPENAISIVENGGNEHFLYSLAINTPDNLIFIISWIMIFIIIIIAFPIYYYYQNSYIKSLVRKLKDKSITEIQKLMTIHEVSPKNKLDTELKYLTLINNIEDSRDKPLSSYNIIPILSSIGSISIHFIKISESLL